MGLPYCYESFMEYANLYLHFFIRPLRIKAWRNLWTLLRSSFWNTLRKSFKISLETTSRCSQRISCRIPSRMFFESFLLGYIKDFLISARYLRVFSGVLSGKWTDVLLKILLIFLHGFLRGFHRNLLRVFTVFFLLKVLQKLFLRFLELLRWFFKSSSLGSTKYFPETLLGVTFGIRRKVPPDIRIQIHPRIAPSFPHGIPARGFFGTPAADFLEFTQKFFSGIHPWLRFWVPTRAYPGFSPELFSKFLQDFLLECSQELFFIWKFLLDGFLWGIVD